MVWSSLIFTERTPEMQTTRRLCGSTVHAIRIAPRTISNLQERWIASFCHPRLKASKRAEVLAMGECNARETSYGNRTVRLRPSELGSWP